MNKKKIGIIIGILLFVVIVILTIFLNHKKSEDSEIEASDVTGVWYSETAEVDEFAISEEGVYSSSTLFSYGTYSFTAEGKLRIEESDSGNAYTFDVETDSNGTAIRLVSTSDIISVSYVRDRAEAAQVSADEGTTEYATKSAEIAVPQILATGSWTLSDATNGERLTFDISKVSLSWTDAGETKTAQWSLVYKAFKVNNVKKPVETEIELLPINDIANSFGGTLTGYVYLDTSDTEKYSFTSSVFPTSSGLSNKDLLWEQAINDDLLAAADDSYKGGESVIIATDGTYNTATEDPFSNSFIEPEIGSVDPETDKVIDVYSRIVSGDYCYINITYTDGTTSKKTIQRQVQVAPQQVDIDYPD